VQLLAGDVADRDARRAWRRRLADARQQWHASIGYFAVHDFARGLIAVGAGDVGGSRAALGQLHDRINSARGCPGWRKPRLVRCAE